MSQQEASSAITQHIFLSTESMSWCVKCNRCLISGKAHVPLGDYSIEEIDGLECPRCHMIYLIKSDLLTQKLTNNFYVITNDLHGKTEWKYAKEDLEREARQRHTETQQLIRALQYENADRQERENKAKRKVRCEKLLAEIKTSQFCIVLRDENSHETDVVIVLSITFADSKRNILYCHHPEAKEMMTYAFHTKIPGQFFSYHNHTVSVADIVYPRDRSKGNIYFPRKILLRKGGGYYNSKKPNAILATAMVYSPFSGTYEPLMVSYDEDEGIYFVDPEKFRSFLHEHGNPQLPIAVYKKGSEDSYWGFGDLNEQSFLTGFGYNVNSNEDLSREVRHEMLTELVDLGIAQPWEIVHHLHWCIRFFAADKYRFAREKWEEDAAYISFYKANPQRFLIASHVGK